MIILRMFEAVSTWFVDNTNLKKKGSIRILCLGHKTTGNVN